jgi:DNA-directed RNA polymerase specialized sigma24 family protein
MNSISDSVNQAFEDATSSYGSHPLTDAANRHSVLSGLSAPDLVHQATEAPAPPAVLDGLWTAVIDSYRLGPRPFWGAVVLKMVAPTLLHKIARVRYERHLGEDVGQQLISGVLQAAATERLPDPARWTPNRLATRSVTRTRRWLTAEARSRCLYLGDLPEPASEPESETDDLASLLAALRRAGLTDATAVLLYRNRVLGEPLAGIADQLGVSEEALEMRRFRAEERIRRGAA